MNKDENKKRDRFAAYELVSGEYKLITKGKNLEDLFEKCGGRDKFNEKGYYIMPLLDPNITYLFKAS